MVLAGYRYSPPPGPPSSHPGYTPPPAPRYQYVSTTAVFSVEYGRGLISVGQLTWRPLFSGFQGMTEVYNLSGIGRITNHSFISGNK